MNWIKVNPLHRMTDALSRDSGGLRVLVIAQSPKGPAQIALGTVTPGNVDPRTKYESDFEDVAWELGIRTPMAGVL